MALDEQGELLAGSKASFGFVDLRHEQPPEIWWRCVLSGLQNVTQQLGKMECSHSVKALSVTSTSGTVIPLDKDYNPLGPALMYSDDRSALQVETCAIAAGTHDRVSYQKFNTSWALPKICWFTENNPRKSDKIRLWVHATDYLIGKLSGVWGMSDYTSVLKTGYDLDTFQWPEYIRDSLRLPMNWFPKVVPSGTPVGKLTPSVCAATGLPQTVIVVTGMTDGCASQIAAGAVAPGEWSTTIGTTLVVKGVSRDKIIDPYGTIYNHRHPQGHWMPGGASNTGADWVSLHFEQDEVDLLNRRADFLAPTQLLSWPLLQNGERFPFLSSTARGFYPEGVSRELHYASCLEGVGYIERMAYERMERLTGTPLEIVYTAGGASQSAAWLRIRSNILRVPIVKMKNTEGAAGAAILAGTGTYFGTLQAAAQSMLHPQTTVYPESRKADVYDQTYADFRAKLIQQAYIHDFQS